ncbi:MAG: hypothetical protein P8171_22770 [Candidatus Thiodiazotropha sp.]
MRHRVSLLLLTGLPLILAQAEEAPDLDLLMFLAEFTDEQGNWDAPEIDQVHTLETEAGAEQ